MMISSDNRGRNSNCESTCLPRLKAALFRRTEAWCLAAGYSLIELVVATGIIALVYGVVINCYIQSGLRAQWAGYSLAAQSLATEQIEQARSAVWDPALGSGGKNDVTNLNLTGWKYTGSNGTWSGYTTAILDVPYSSTNYTVATNFVTVQLFYLNNQSIPPVQMQIIRVDTVWPFKYRKGNLLFTNTAVMLLAPDNRDPSAL